MLPYAVAPDRHGPVLHYGIPKESSCTGPRSIIRHFSDALIAYYFWDLGVGMEAGEGILLLHQRVEDTTVGKTAGKFQVLLIAGSGSYIGKGFIQSAMLTAQHLLYLGIG